MLLRDLLTRFSFEVDKKDVANYDKTIGNMSSKALKLGAVFAGVFSAKKLLGSGRTARQARDEVKRLAGPDFDKLQNNLLKIRKSADDVRSNSGEQILNKDYDLSLASHIQAFGKNKGSIEKFNKAFLSSALQAISTDKNIAEEYDKALKFVTNGQTDVFDKLPGYNARVKSRSEFNLKAIIPENEPSGDISRNIRWNELLKQQARATPQIIKNVRSLDDKSFEDSRSRRLAGEVGDKTGENLDRKLVPVYKAANDMMSTVLDVIDKGPFGKTDKEGNTEAGNSWRSLPDDLKRIFGDSVKSRQDHINNVNKKLLDKRNESLNKISNKSNEQKVTQKIEVKANISIVSPDPISAGKAVKKEVESLILEAERQLIKTEDNRP